MGACEAWLGRISPFLSSAVRVVWSSYIFRLSSFCVLGTTGVKCGTARCACLAVFVFRKNGDVLYSQAIGLCRQDPRFNVIVSRGLTTSDLSLISPASAS